PPARARRPPPPSRPDRAGDPHATEKERPDKKAVQIDRADARIRTADPFITSEVLYQLSYVGGGLRSVPPISQFHRLRLLDPLGDAARVGVVRSHVRDLGDSVPPDPRRRARGDAGDARLPTHGPLGADPAATRRAPRRAAPDIRSLARGCPLRRDRDRGPVGAALERRAPRLELARGIADRG